jgi:hypothetical protein
MNAWLRFAATLVNGSDAGGCNCPGGLPVAISNSRNRRGYGCPVFSAWRIDQGYCGTRDVLAGLLGGAVWIAKISTVRILHVLAAVQQPQNDEKSHHCGDEVGINDLPGAPVMAAVPAFFLMITDGRFCDCAKRSLRLPEELSLPIVRAGGTVAAEASDDVVPQVAGIFSAPSFTKRIFLWGPTKKTPAWRASRTERKISVVSSSSEIPKPAPS